MTGQLRGKRVVMTGKAHGIGRATALLFGREGARLVLADVNADGGNATAAAANPRLPNPSCGSGAPIRCSGSA